MYNYFILGLLFVMTFVLGMGCGVTIALMQTVHAQLYNTTVPVPISVPTLQYQPNIPVQQSAATATNTDLNGIISSIVVTAIGVIVAKISSDKKAEKATDKVEKKVFNVADVVKDVVAEMLKNKEATKELARVTYDMNPTEAAKITDAPAVKLATLTEDTAQFADKAAKTSLPEE